MKTILMFQWFDCKADSRRVELESCIEHNLRLGFDETIIFNDSVEPRFRGDKITNLPINRRMCFRDFIDVVNDPENFGSLVVLTNTDIKLADDFLRIAHRVRAGDFLCFARYEPSTGQLADIPFATQDVWAMVSQPVHNSAVYQSEIPLGMAGCENRFAEIMFNVGFAVFNPCLDVRNVHVQSNPSRHDDANRIYGAFLLVPPCTLAEFEQRDPRRGPTLVYGTRRVQDKVFPIPLR